MEQISVLKKKIRKLKQLEKTIRKTNSDNGLVWNTFFGHQAKYTLEQLACMDKNTYKRVIDEYFSYVYYKFYTECETGAAFVFDPETLSWLGLPPDADQADVRKRFRELAKIHHPDAGGDAARFIELMDKYKKLMGQP